MRHRLAVHAMAAVLLGTVIALAFTAPAFADATSDYASWTEPFGTDTPHSGYATTTTKCSVCHAVHKGTAGGEVLLRTTVADACTYCHITTNIGVIVLYDGDLDRYETDYKTNHSAAGGASCGGCHSVHGADIYLGDMSRKILRRLPIQPSLVELLTGDPDAALLVYESDFPYTDGGGSVMLAPPHEYEIWGSPKEIQQTAFCTGCHPYYTRASEDAITTDRMIVDGQISTDTRTFTSHPMKRYWDYLPDGTEVIDFQAAGSTLPPGSQVAYMSTNGCYRCHGENYYIDLGAGTHTSSYPHDTPLRERFLISSDEDGNWLDETPDSRQDGTCFHCHLNSGSNQGVGLDW